MTIWEAFTHLHPFVQWSALWLAWVPLLLVYNLTLMPFRLVNRAIRSRNIRERGWPPPHLDADGDFKKDDNDD